MNLDRSDLTVDQLGDDIWLALGGPHVRALLEPCETCGGDGLRREPSCGAIRPGGCPDCINGRRKFDIVVPCPTCSVEQGGRLRPGMELCTRCKPGHWEFCDCNDLVDGWPTSERPVGTVSRTYTVADDPALLPVVNEDAWFGTDLPPVPHIVVLRDGSTLIVRSHAVDTWGTEDIITLVGYDPDSTTHALHLRAARG